MIAAVEFNRNTPMLVSECRQPSTRRSKYASGVLEFYLRIAPVTGSEFDCVCSNRAAGNPSVLLAKRDQAVDKGADLKRSPDPMLDE